MTLNQINHRRRIDVVYGGTPSDPYADINSLSDVVWNLNRIVAAKCDAVMLRRTNAQVNDQMNGGANKISWFLTESKKRGLKFGLILEPVVNVSAQFDLSSTNQQAFVSRLAWILQRYPNIDCVELEEPMYNNDDESQMISRQTTLNPYFKSIRDTCNQYHSGLILGFNMPRVTYTWRGIDPAYIRANQIFDYIAHQNYWVDLTTFINYNAETTSVMGIPLLPWIATRDYSGSGMNQAFFDEVKYCTNNNIPHGIFWDGDLDISASSFPQDSTPGTDIKTKLGNIIIDMPTPPPTPMRYSCNGSYQCIEDPNGSYETLAACNLACKQKPLVLSSIVVAPQTATILVGESLVVIGTAIDSSGKTMGGVPIVWTSDPSGVVEIDPINTATFIDGKISTKIKGILPGMCMIKGTSGSISGLLIMDVNAVEPVIKWKCSGEPDYTCVPDLNGNYLTQAECQLACKVPPPTTKDVTNEQIIMIAAAAMTLLR